MKVKMLTTVRGAEHSYDINEVVDIPQELAVLWEARRVCEMLEAPKRAEKPQSETTEAKPALEEAKQEKSGKKKSGK